MRHVTLVVIAPLVIVAAGCTRTPPSEAVPDGPLITRGRLGDTLTVPLGGEAVLDDGRLRVRFAARLTDSRCPANAMCVWQGDASVRLRLRAGAVQQDTVLHTALEPMRVTVAGYAVHLAGVMPYPGTWYEGTPEPAPTAQLVVTRP